MRDRQRHGLTHDAACAEVSTAQTVHHHTHMLIYCLFPVPNRRPSLRSQWKRTTMTSDHAHHLLSFSFSLIFCSHQCKVQGILVITSRHKHFGPPRLHHHHPRLEYYQHHTFFVNFIHSARHSELALRPPISQQLPPTPNNFSSLEPPTQTFLHRCFVTFYVF